MLLSHLTRILGNSFVGGYSLGGYSLGCCSLGGYNLGSYNLEGHALGLYNLGGLRTLTCRGLLSGELQSWGGPVWGATVVATDLGIAQPLASLGDTAMGATAWGLQPQWLKPDTGNGRLAPMSLPGSPSQICKQHIHFNSEDLQPNVLMVGFNIQ